MKRHKRPDLVSKIGVPFVITDTLKGGSQYLPQLARYPDDPEAYVSSRSEIKRILAKRGWGAKGVVECEPKPYGDGKYEPAPDLVEEEVIKEVAEKGIKPTEDNLQELRDKAKARIVGKLNDDV